MPSPDDVLDFWFREIDPKLWWVHDPSFDDAISTRFGRLHERASAGELYPWRSTPGGRLAEIIVLDQFSRNIHRDTPRMFAQDAAALVLSQEAVAAGALAAFDLPGRAFLLMPYTHSESAEIHAVAEALFREHAPKNLEFELKHKAIVDRFGRYPHRNAILGRTSTPEEIEFLTQPGSSF